MPDDLMETETEPSPAAGPGTIRPAALWAAGRWPLCSGLDLAALPEAVPCARLHARLITAEWGLSELADPAELIVSELLTNAIRVSGGLTGWREGGRRVPGAPPVRLRLGSDRRQLMIQVWDADHRLPGPAEAAGPEAGSSRGLLLVTALSAAWGAFVPEAMTGKVTWAIVGPDTIPRQPEP